MAKISWSKQRVGKGCSLHTQRFSLCTGNTRESGKETALLISTASIESIRRFFSPVEVAIVSEVLLND